MTWCTILYELKPGILLKPVIKHRNNMLNVGFHIDMTPVLLPEYTWFFCCFIEATSKHPICIASLFLYYTGWIQLFTMPDTDPYSLVYSSLNPCFICS